MGRTDESVIVSAGGIQAWAPECPRHMGGALMQFCGLRTMDLESSQECSPMVHTGWKKLLRPETQGQDL